MTNETNTFLSEGIRMTQINEKLDMIVEQKKACSGKIEKLIAELNAYH